MKSNKVDLRTSFFAFLILGVLFIFNQSIDAQLFEDFSVYVNRYPSKPYVRLQDNVELEVMLDKFGKPYFKIKETSIKLVLKDNCEDLSEFRNYYNATDEIIKTVAYSIVTENGKERKIMTPALKKTTEQDNSSYFDDSYSMVGYFPAIAKGTKLYSYNEYVSHLAYNGYKFYFGESAPVESSGISVTVPENIKMICRLAGKDTSLVKYSVSQKGKMTTYTWKCEQLKDYAHDRLAPTVRYYIPHLCINIASFEQKDKFENVMGNIDDLYRWEKEKLKNTNQPLSPIVKLLADSIISGCKTPVEKVKAIYRWVQDEIKYVAIEDGDNGFVPQEATTIINRRYGDCKDKSVLLTSLLRSIGEKASLACVGTRLLPYTFTKYPMVATANHLICIWWDSNNTPIPLDGTTRHLGIFNVPASIQGKECLILKDQNDFIVYRIPIDTPDKNMVIDTMNLKIVGNQLHVNGLLLLNNEEKSELMYDIEGKNDVQKLDAISNYLDFAGNKIQIQKYVFDGLTDPEQQLKLQYEIILPDYCIVAGDRLYVNMNLYNQYSQIDIKNDRSIPLEAERIFTHTITSKLEIPNTYDLSGLPEKSEFNHPLFGFKINYKLDKNVIVQETKLWIGFQVVDNEELVAFKDMIQSLKRAYRKTVMFQKKKN